MSGASQLKRRAHRQKVGDHTLIRGDCLRVLSCMQAQSFDLVVTSPPYNIGLGYHVYNDHREEEEYLDWMFEVCAAIKRVMRPDASFFLNISGSSSRPWIPFELGVRLRNLFVLQNQIVWVKSITVGDDTFGHFKPINSQRFLHHNHEWVFHLTHNGDVPLKRLGVGVPYKDKSNIRRRGHAHDLRCRGNTWFIPYETVQSKTQKFNHPGTFPVALPQYCIRLHGRPRARILDPFMGTGTTLLAADMENAQGTGIDMDSDYVRIAKERLKLHRSGRE